LPVSLVVVLLQLWQRWEAEVEFRWLKSGFGLGEKPCWGLDSGERSVACVGVERVSWVGRVLGSCAVDCSGCVVERAV